MNYLRDQPKTKFDNALNLICELVRADNQPYNRIILVGNGFDLAVGLKSKLSDFVFFLFKQLLLHPEKRTQFKFQIKRDFKSTIRELDNLQKRFVEKAETILAITDYFDKQNIYWETEFSLLKRIILEGTANWVNIEMLYYRFLMEQYNKYKKGNLTINVLREKILEHNKCMTLIGVELSAYLSEEQGKLPNLPNQEKISTFLEASFEPFVKRREIEQKHVLASWQWDSPANAVFVNFNYTNILEKILETQKKRKGFQHIYIHGSIDTTKNNPLIFGYGDDTSDEYRQMELLEEDVLLDKIKSFHYPRTENYHLLLNILDEAKFEVFIFGHSCGMTDKTLLNTIFEHPNCFGIKNFHHSGEPSDFKKRIAISRHFTDKKLMRERVFPFDENAKFPV